ncbi:MAG: HAD family hydrolase [Ignavibacteria bacterium]
MKQIKSIVFDLDGTLISSAPTIYKCMLRTFREFDIAVEIPEQEFNQKIGYHFKDIFEDFKIEVPDLESFINTYKQLYFEFIDESHLYPNVEKTLLKLADSGLSISLLTTKAQDQAEDILKHFNLTRYFNLIVGRRPGHKIKPAPDALHYICNELIIPAENTIMVGDSELDIQCGKNTGTKTCAVTFGYRTKPLLQLEEPDYIIDNIAELIGIAGC